LHSIPHFGNDNGTKIFCNYWPVTIILTRWSINSYVDFKRGINQFNNLNPCAVFKKKKNELELFIYVLRHVNWNCFRIGTRVSYFEMTLSYQWLQSNNFWFCVIFKYEVSFEIIWYLILCITYKTKLTKHISFSAPSYSNTCNTHLLCITLQIAEFGLKLNNVLIWRQKRTSNKIEFRVLLNTSHTSITLSYILTILETSNNIQVISFLELDIEIEIY